MCKTLKFIIRYDSLKDGEEFKDLTEYVYANDIQDAINQLKDYCDRNCCSCEINSVERIK